MPAPYGVTDTGFSAKTLAEILAELRTRQREEISETLDTSTDSPIGQLNGIFASKVRELWEVAEEVYASMDPRQATGRSLENLSAITGTLRSPATKSRVTATVNVDNGFSAAIGEMVAYVDGDPTARFVNAEAVENVSGSAANVAAVFEAETAGELAAYAGTLTKIAEPLSGWNSVTNAADAAIGDEAATDEELRQSREAELAASGGSTIDGIEADLLALTGVEQVRVFENATDSIDADGLPPHSIEALVYDGTTAGTVVAANDIAQLLWESKPSAVVAHGSSSGTAQDRLGVERTVEFSRPSVVDFWVLVTVDFDESVYEAGSTEDAIEQAIADWGDQRLTMGTDIVYHALIAAIMGIAGVQDVTTLLVEDANPPTLSENVVVPERSIASFDTSRITATVNPV